MNRCSHCGPTLAACGCAAFDRLDKLWALQAAQQEHWYDVAALSSEDRSAIAMELLLNAQKQLTDLQRMMVAPYHLLKREHAPTPAAVVSPATGLAKILIALLQLGAVDADSFVAEFMRETAAVTAKWRWEQDALADTEVLLCDIDGCIGSWVKAFCVHLDGINVQYHPERLNAPELEEHKTNFHNAGGFLRLPHSSEAVRVLNAWRAASPTRRLILVTARPYRQHRRIYGDTSSWCQEIGLKHDHILFEPDKAEAVRRVQPARIVAHVEDRGRHALEVANTGVLVLKLPNEGTGAEEDVKHPNVIPVSDWGDIETQLERLAAPRR